MWFRRVAPALTVAALLSVPLPAVAQRTGGEIVTPRVDLLAARDNAIPKIRLQIEESWITLPSGTYRSSEGASITVRDGEIRSVMDPSARSAFTVAKIDAVGVRIGCCSRIVLLDGSGRTAALPDGRFVSDERTTLVIRDGAIVGFGTRR